MKRRNFLKSSSIAAVVAALPLSSLSAKSFDCEPDDYKGTKRTNDDLKYEWLFSLCHKTISDFGASDEADRTLNVKITKSLSGEIEVLGQYMATYKIVSSKEVDENIYNVSAQLITDKSDGSSPAINLNDLPVDFKNLDFSFEFGEATSTVFVKDKSDKDHVKLALDLDFGCFLTTACVQTLGKPDNCLELTTLRHFRDNILVNMEGGRELIKEYYAIAPEIVRNIDQQRARKDIYLSIYDRMIVPVIENIRDNNYARAVDIYRDQTLGLKARYVLREARAATTLIQQ